MKRVLFHIIKIAALLTLFFSGAVYAQDIDTLNISGVDSSVTLISKELENDTSGIGLKESENFQDLLTELELEDSIKQLYAVLKLKQKELSYKVFRYGIIGFWALKQTDNSISKNLLTIIDYTKTSCEKRFYTIDLDQLRLKYNTYVSHGRNTGQNKAIDFSNIPHSNQSSLGFYITAETYSGKHGYSLRLDGLEEGYNSNARQRAIVIHKADYVSEGWIKKYGRLGRSQGCPALPKELSEDIINTIKDRTVVFAYFSDTKYLKASRFLDISLILSSDDN